MKGISEKIKILLLKRKMSQTELANKLNMSMQNLNNKLRRDSFDYDELQKIADILNAKYSFKQWFIMNDTGEEI